MSPWVKLGNVIFRASLIQMRSDGGRLEARLRPGPVLDALIALANGSRHDVVLTVRERSFPIRPTNVTTIIESGTRTSVTIEYKATEPPSPMGMAFSSGSVRMTAEEIVGFRLEQQLFGKRVPEFFVFWCDFNIDLGVLRDTTLPDAATVSMVRLLIVEALVGGGYVGAMRQIEIGTLGEAGRRVRVRWVDRKIYTNVEPAEREIEGIIPRS